MIKKEDIVHIASLARISLSEDELKFMEKDLGKILDYVTKLQQLDVEKVQPTTHALPMSNVDREDKVVPSLDREKVLAMAIQKDKGAFKVPKVIE